MDIRAAGSMPRQVKKMSRPVPEIPQPLRLKGGPLLLIGHRGCSYPGYNQNTIRAFDKVASEGVPAIEFDVQLSSDRQLVVVHNLDLREVSTGNGKVSDTDTATLKSLCAGDPARGKDHIPLLPEVFDFFSSLEREVRPYIHLELKGENTGEMVGELFTEYVSAGKLDASDLLASSFNWQELKNLRRTRPTTRIALLDGAIRRSSVLAKTGKGAERYFGVIFAYGNEEYMLPRFNALDENLELLDQKCSDTAIRAFLAEVIRDCLGGRYYTDELLDTAWAMNAVSVNLWYRSVTPDFVEKAHARGLAVYVYTVNAPDELLAVADMGVDGIFTDYYRDTAQILTDHQP